MPDGGYEDDDLIEMSVPAEAEEEPFEVLTQNQLSSDQAHIMPQLFGWIEPGLQRERARYLADLTRPRPSRSGASSGPGDGLVSGLPPGERQEEQESPTTRA